MRQKILAVLEKIHFKLFGHTMSGTMHDFLRHLSWSFLGLVISSAALFAINVWAGRILGPEEYGKYNFVLTLAYVFNVFMLAGQDMTAMRYVAASKDNEEKEGVKANSLLVVLMISLVLCVAGFFLAVPFAKVLGATKMIVLLSLAYAFLFSMRGLLDSFLRAEHKFKAQAILKIWESVLIVLLFYVFFAVLKEKSYEFYVFSLLGGFVFFSLLFVLKNPVHFFATSRKIWQKTSKYTRGAFSVSIVTILAASVDKLFVGKFVGVRELGLYSAYLTSSILLTSQLIAVFSNAFFPMISKLQDKEGIRRKIDRLTVLLFVPGTAGILLVSGALLKLFGKAYAFDWLFLFLFSLSAYLQLSASFYRNLAMADEKAYGNFLRYSTGMLLGFVFLLIFAGALGIGKLLIVVEIYALYNALYWFLTRRSALVKNV